MNPFMLFPGSNGSNHGPNQNNPFAVQQMLFEVYAVNEQTGAVKEGVMQVSLPCNATEIAARKMILDMGYQHGWVFRSLKRLSEDGSEA